MRLFPKHQCDPWEEGLCAFHANCVPCGTLKRSFLPGAILFTVNTSCLCRALLQQDLGDHLRMPDVGGHDGGILAMPLSHAGLHLLG